jgi:hypothetical protein
MSNGRRGLALRRGARGARRPRQAVMRDELACELIEACMTALGTYGIGKGRLLQLTREALRKRTSQHETTSSVLDSTQQLAELIAKWGDDPRYLDEAGKPAVLSIRGGKFDFASLAKKYFPNKDLQEVLEFGCETNAIGRISKTKVARINDYVAFSGNSLLILAHSVQSVRRFLSTANFNRQDRVALALNEGRADRTSAREISARDLSKFMGVMRPQLSDLVDMSNRWLARRPRDREARATGSPASMHFSSSSEKPSPVIPVLVASPEEYVPSCCAATRCPPRGRRIEV